MFERWAENPRTFKRVYRQVYVDMRKALPGCVGGFVRNRNISVRADGLRIEEWMRGHQIAWIRTHDSHWLGIVKVEAQSSNELYDITMTLWLPPSMFQLERPDYLFERRYRRRL